MSAAIGPDEAGDIAGERVAMHLVAHEVIGGHLVGAGQRVPQRILRAADEGLHHEVGFSHPVLSFQS
jgi:hypothetical protein